MQTYFDHEKLDVYRLELQFITWATALVARVKLHAVGVRLAEVSDQLDRASLSSLLNTAEGNGKRQRQGRAKFFDDARGSATECAACLDALVAKGACVNEEIAEGKALLVRIASMLSKLVARFDSEAMGYSSSVVREDEGSGEDSSSAFLSSSSKDEHENEDENEDDKTKLP
jgi:four helix bundle protein